MGIMRFTRVHAIGNPIWKTESIWENFQTVRMRLGKLKSITVR